MGMQCDHLRVQGIALLTGRPQVDGVGAIVLNNGQVVRSDTRGKGKHCCRADCKELHDVVYRKRPVLRWGYMVVGRVNFYMGRKSFVLRE